MKSNFSLHLLALACAAQSALAAALSKQENANNVASNACGDPRKATPWYRAYNAGTVDHFYTTSQPEFGNSFNLGYNNEGIAAFTFANPQPTTVPLFRAWHGGVRDHFYTTNVAEKDNAVNGGWSDEGITGWVYPNAACGGFPLYRLFSGGAAFDHFYTTSASEKDSAVANGYIYEGIVGYVFP